MKKGMFTRLISLVLSAALLMGCIVMLPVSAATVSTSGNYATIGSSTDGGIRLLLNRDFEDGSTVHNGGSLSSGNAKNVMEIAEVNGNSFVRFTTQGNHDYIVYDVSSYTPESGSIVIQMDIMVESNTTYAPGIIQMNPKVRGSSADVYQVTQVGRYSGKSQLVPVNKSSTGTSGYPMESGVWYTTTFVWSWSDKTEVTLTVYNGAGATATYVDRAADGAAGCTDVRPGQLRVGITSAATGSWCMDNVIIYSTTETDPAAASNHTVSKNNKGIMFNEHANTQVNPDAFNGNYFMKVGVERALNTKNELVLLSYAPQRIDGVVYVPVTALSELDIEIIDSSHLTTVNRRKYVALEDVTAATGYYCEYSSMGLICLTEDAELSFDGLTVELIPPMQRFVFEGINTELKNANAFDVSDMTSLSHPYLFASSERFAELREAYENPEADPVLYSYIASQVKIAANVYNGYAKVTNGEYDGTKNDYSKIPYIDAYGYDVGGRLGEAASHAERLQQLAFGYQITGNDDYARLGYDYAVALGQWEHWGPGHFLNCADAAGPYAAAYDWFYNGWAKLGLDVSVIEDIILTHALLPAYYSEHDNGCPWYDPVVSSGWNYHTRNNNWNAVCSAGVTAAALAVVGVTTDVSGTLLDIEIDGVYNPTVASYAGTSGTITRKDGKSFKTDSTGLNTIQDFAEYLVNVCLYSLPMYGMEQYAPDGSYIESNGYWAYGTNNFFEMVATLISATGSDYGLLDCWGIDRTAYYALNTQSGDTMGWNYHDSGSTGAQDTSWFQFLGSELGLGDKALAGIRKKIVATAANVSPSRYDAIYYMSDDEIGEFKMPELQYHMEGIDGYVVRDSWDSGGIFAGIMGNTNNLGHGQIDSGAFVYYNGPTAWFCDVGTEQYNAYGFWGSGTRYTYYKMNAEGNNTLLLTSRQSDVPYGQTLNGFGHMTEVYDNEYGAYALIDNRSVYGGYADSALRGMLLTNDRRTVVIQDEVSFAEAEDLVWVGHTQQEVILSTDGTVAYMYNGSDVLKVTIIDPDNLGLRFEHIDTYDFLLNCTVGPNYSTDNGGVAEHNRNGYSRLIIRCNDVKRLRLAVVMEEVAVGESLNDGAGYEWCDMQDWEPTKDGRITNSELGSADFDSDGTLEVRAEGSLTEVIDAIGSNNALIIGTNAESSGGRVSLLPLRNKTEYGSIGQGTVTVEADISTSLGYPDGISLALTSKGGTLASIPLSSLGTVAVGEWVRVTVVLDAGSDTVYYFFGGALVGTGVGYPDASHEGLALALIQDVGAQPGGNLIMDNVTIRYFSEDYTKLDGSLSEGSLTSWSDATPELRTLEGKQVVATVTVGSNEAGDDTPIVDIFGTTVYRVLDENGRAKTVIEAYSFEALEAAIVKGCTVELLASNANEPIVINAPCTVLTGGYRFNATSPDYVATVNGNTIKYAVGSITVSWVTDSGTVTEVYTGSVEATYKGALSSAIHEKKQENNTYRYTVRDAWSLTPDGDAASGADMTVSSVNKVFYLTGRPYEGAFVTVKGSVITGYLGDSDFFKSHVFEGGYDRVSLTRDIYFDSTGISHHKNIKYLNLYLNGYELEYHTDDSADHMLQPNSNTAELYIHGPGTINSATTAGNPIYCNNGYVEVEDVTIICPRGITDTRQGTNIFRNCDVYITKKTNAFGVNNRNNAVTNAERYPTVIIEGCRLYMEQGSTAVFSIWNNASIQVMGGTSIISSSKIDSLFSLQSSTTGTVNGFDYANATNDMKAVIGEAYFTATALCSSGTNDPSGTKYDLSDKLFYGKGSVFAEKPGEAVQLMEGLVIARQGDPVYKYVAVSDGDYGNVCWSFGSTLLHEPWTVGCIPSPDSSDLVEAIKNNPPPSGMKYTFSPSKVLPGVSQTVTATVTPDFQILVNMSLSSSFRLNVFVPVNVSGMSFSEFVVDGESISAANAQRITLGGIEYYKLVKANVAPTDATEEYAVSIIGTANSNNITINLSISVMKYASEVLGREDMTREAKELIANLLKYSLNSYEYTNRTTAPGYNALKNLYDAYSQFATAAVVTRKQGDISSISDGIMSACLNLNEVPNFRFNLREGYTGKIILSYVAHDEDGNEVMRNPVYNIVNGKYAGLDYIEIERKAFDLTEQITIKTDAGTAVYDLATYYHNTARELGELTELLNALYAYCLSAESFRASTKS